MANRRCSLSIASFRDRNCEVPKMAQHEGWPLVRNEGWPPHPTTSLSHMHIRPHMHIPTQEMVGLLKLTVVHKACTLRPISSSMGYVWQFTPLGGQ